jgi:hypothetical protein
VIGHAGDEVGRGRDELDRRGVPGVTVIAAMDMQVLALDRDDAGVPRERQGWSVRHRLEVIATGSEGAAHLVLRRRTRHRSSVP